jgi:arylsulfatase A-like enzyme
LTRKERELLNLIYIGTDTWRADHLGCYGNPTVKTPNLDRLAAEGVRFTNVYADGLPTMPMRRVVWTGKSILPKGEWRPLSPGDVTLAQLVKEQGYRTALFVDCPHFFAPGMNYHQHFDTWEWIRGQEMDRWVSGPRAGINWREHVREHWWSEVLEERLIQYLLNTRHRRSEEDYFCARTCNAAMRWLEDNGREQPFLLWLEMFDPHEPWDAPRRFQEMYCKELPFERTYFGYGVNTKNLTEEDYSLVRGLYAAEVTFSDQRIGQLVRRVEELGLLERTVLIFATDHGTHLGEGGCVHKTSSRLDSTVAQLPLLIRHPDTAKYAGKVIDALISGIDYAPTLLSLAGGEAPAEMEGRDFWPIVEGELEAIHEELFIGFMGYGAIRTKEWHYYTRVPQVWPLAPGEQVNPCLFDLRRDPKETRNVAEQHPEVVKELQRKVTARFSRE